VPETPIPRADGDPIDLAQTVVVALGDRASTRAGDHAALRALVARLSRVSLQSVTLSQRCTQCGAAGHGPLQVTLAGEPGEPGTPSEPGHSPALWVSLSRAAGRLALAVTASGPVGIDLESEADLATSPVADVLLSDAEAALLHTMSRAGAAAAMGALWTTKEAVLKAAGVGLRVDPRDLTVGLERAEPAGGGRPVDPGSPSHPTAPANLRTLIGWPLAPFPLHEVHLLPVPAPAGTFATVAVVCVSAPRLVML